MTTGAGQAGALKCAGLPVPQPVPYPGTAGQVWLVWEGGGGQRKGRGWMGGAVDELAQEVG